MQRQYSHAPVFFSPVASTTPRAVRRCFRLASGFALRHAMVLTLHSSAWVLYHSCFFALISSWVCAMLHLYFQYIITCQIHIPGVLCKGIPQRSPTRPLRALMCIILNDSPGPVEPDPGDSAQSIRSHKIYHESHANARGIPCYGNILESFDPRAFQESLS